MSSTPSQQRSSSPAASTSPTATAVDFSTIRNQGSSQSDERANGARLRNRVRNRPGARYRQSDIDDSAPLLSAAGTTTKNSTTMQVPRRQKRSRAAKRPTVDVRRLGHFKTKIGMLQDSRNLRFRKLYKAPDPVVIFVFIGSILLWYVLFNYIKSWK